MTLEARVVALAQAIGTDVKTLNKAVGSLGSLTTTAKNSLVAAINEIAQAAASATGINDGVTSGASTWSSSKINSEISGAISGLVGGAGAALDPERFMFMNTDTTVHLHRAPVGPEFCLRARGSIGPDGLGSTTAELFDEQGFFGTSAQTLLVQRR